MSKLHIAIPVYNQMGYLKQCLDSIIRTCPPELQVTVQVIDSASQEPMVPYVKAPELHPLLPTNLRFEHVRLDRNLGVTVPWNIGLDRGMAFGADVICISNSDVVYGPMALLNCYRVALLRGACFPASIQGGPLPADFDERADRDAKLCWHDNFFDTGGFAGWSFFLGRETVEKVGRFDEQFTLWYQDTDYHWRLSGANRRPVEVRSCLIHHFESRTIASMPGGFDCHGWRREDERRFKQKYPR